jgi:hypothetical protein
LWGAYESNITDWRAACKRVVGCHVLKVVARN